MREQIDWQATPLDHVIMDLLDTAGSREVRIYSRQVKDGALRAVVSCDPPDYLWHLSITHAKRGRHDERYPSWEEVTHARYELLPGNLTMALYLPPIEEVTRDDTHTLYLREVKSADDR